jgi:hypothetical protein
MVRGLSSVVRSNHNVCNRSQFRFFISCGKILNTIPFSIWNGESKEDNQRDVWFEGRIVAPPLATSMSKTSCDVTLSAFFVRHLVQCSRDAKKSMQADLRSEVLQIG